VAEKVEQDEEIERYNRLHNQNKRLGAFKSLSAMANEQRRINSFISLKEAEDKIKTRQRQEETIAREKEQKAIDRQRADERREEEKRRLETFQTQRQTDALATQEQVAQLVQANMAKATKGFDEETKESTIKGSVIGLKPLGLPIPPAMSISGRSRSDETGISSLTEGSPRPAPRGRPPKKLPPPQMTNPITGFFSAIIRRRGITNAKRCVFWCYAITTTS
jgi:hypothetical protein